MAAATVERRAIHVSVLGPLALRVDGATVEVPGSKRRAVLAMLAMAAPNRLGADPLVDAVWPHDPPASGRAALQSHVSRLRRHLGPHAGRLSSTDAGYRLELDDGELDAVTFESLVREGRRLAEESPARACDVLAEACSWWRGPPLDELSEVEPLRAWARALTETWLEASDLCVDCALRVGSSERAAQVARAAVAVEPLREPSVVRFVRSLAAQRRATEALRVAHDYRLRLREETGLDPSPALAAAEHEIAAGVGTLDLDGGSGPPTPPFPVPSGTFVGREAEVTGVERLLATERLVTLVGAGGVGKTRLSFEVAHRVAPRFEPSLLDLASVTDADVLPDVLANALGTATGSGAPIERCVARLREGSPLLVVDNCEHVLDAVRALLSTLLARCPGLTVLATSRERLALAAEQTVRLAPLPMPAADGGDQVGGVPSVALFLERARRVRPELTVDGDALVRIARIVRALDGVPLAIELAAGRLSSLTLADLEARLDRALDLLGVASRAPVPTAAPARHRTLRAAVQWSYDLLDHDEQRVFRNLAVFPGGVDLATAETVARSLGPEVDPVTALAHLVDASMVVADLDAMPRYRMLDTLRQFGLDCLSAAGEADAATARLLDWAVALTTELDEAYATEHETGVDERLRAELPNLRAAWRTARDTGVVDVAAALAVNLYSHASWREITELFRWSLELAEDPALVGHRREAEVLGVAAEAAWSSRGDLERAELLARRAVSVVGDDDQRGRALALWALADVLLFRAQYAEAADLAIRAREGTRWIAEGYAQAALAWTYGGDLRRAHDHLAEAERLVAGPTLRAYLRYVAGEMANVARDWDAAAAAYDEASELARSVNATFIEGIAAVGLASVHVARGDVGAALSSYRELIDRWERSGAWTQQWTTLRNLADLLEQLGDVHTAVALRRAADAAPESAALGGTAPLRQRDSDPAPLARDEVLDLARTAITDRR